MDFYEINDFVKSLSEYEFLDYLSVFFQILLYGFFISFLIGFVVWGIYSAIITFKNIITK